MKYKIVKPITFIKDNENYSPFDPPINKLKKEKAKEMPETPETLETPPIKVVTKEDTKENPIGNIYFNNCTININSKDEKDLVKLKDKSIVKELINFMKKNTNEF